ncbi:MAG: site-2 protease family protein [Bacilli bacterium]|nr:site-2 protease family protein [Bacilli bacterium]
MLLFSWANFGMTILYILLFILCLSILIMIHELGHLMAAKVFKVYCLEYSIGFGPKLIKVKRKKGETYFSLRAIPFGGYVSMYGEGVELPEGETIPPERSLEGIKKWKKSIILVAGVTMNALLALVIFFTVNITFENKYVYPRQLTIAESSIAYNAGLRSYDRIRTYGDGQNEGSSSDKSALNTTFMAQGYYFVGVPGTDYAEVHYTDSTVKNYAPFLYFDGIKNFKDIDYADYLYFYPIDSEGNIQTKVLEINDTISYITVNFKTIEKTYDEKGNVVLNIDHLTDHKVDIQVNSGKLQSFGCSFLVAKEKRQSFGQAVKNTFVNFGEASIAIVKGLGSLFTSASAWKNVGGIVAIGFESTNILQNLGLARFLQLWGIISVNLAIVNLLPFPGLDGWQLLVVIFEAISRRRMPDKAKNIASLIGLGLLFSLMAVILVLDVLKYVFHVL